MSCFLLMPLDNKTAWNLCVQKPPLPNVLFTTSAVMPVPSNPHCSWIEKVEQHSAWLIWIHIWVLC